MDSTDRLLEHDFWLTERLLAHASTLSDNDLDRELWPDNIVFRFDGPEPSLRSALAHHVFAKEVWNAAIQGIAFPESKDNSIPNLQQRHNESAREFINFTRKVRERGQWDDAFVDALCDPPESFTFGSVIAHIITYAAQRHRMVINGLNQLGLQILESSCPMTWERQLETDTSDLSK